MWLRPPNQLPSFAYQACISASAQETVLFFQKIANVYFSTLFRRHVSSIRTSWDTHSLNRFLIRADKDAALVGAQQDKEAAVLRLQQEKETAIRAALAEKEQALHAAQAERDAALAQLRADHDKVQ
jgi:uncharacterized membrane protein YqiK